MTVRNLTQFDKNAVSITKGCDANFNVQNEICKLVAQSVLGNAFLENILSSVAGANFTQANANSQQSYGNNYGNNGYAQNSYAQNGQSNNGMNASMWNQQAGNASGNNSYNSNNILAQLANNAGSNNFAQQANNSVYANNAAQANNIWAQLMNNANVCNTNQAGNFAQGNQTAQAHNIWAQLVGSSNHNGGNYNVGNDQSNNILAQLANNLGQYWGNSSNNAYNNSSINPVVDIVEGSDEFKITAEIAGIEAKHVNIIAGDGYIAIKGEKQQENNTDCGGYLRQECAYGTFQRIIALPQNANFDQVEASFKNGILTISVPKHNAAQSSERKIKIKQAA